MDWRDSKGSDLEKVLPRFISQNIIKKAKIEKKLGQAKENRNSFVISFSRF
jgi:hypothetical protein